MESFAVHAYIVVGRNIGPKRGELYLDVTVVLSVHSTVVMFVCDVQASFLYKHEL